MDDMLYARSGNQYIYKNRIPIKSWCELDAGTLRQASNLAELPFTVKHIAVMRDGHLGYGMPIGGVIATDDMVIPNSVGKDIACGVRYRRLTEDFVGLNILEKIRDQIMRDVPTGAGNKHKKQIHELPADFGNGHVTIDEIENAGLSIGTLGGG